MAAPATFCGVFGHEPSYGVVPLGGFSPGPPNAELARYPSIAKLRAEMREAGFVG